MSCLNYLQFYYHSMQLLIDNIGRPAPNITHLLLKFDLDGPVERTLLQPKFHYRCLLVLSLCIDITNFSFGVLFHALTLISV